MTPKFMNRKRRRKWDQVDPAVAARAAQEKAAALGAGATGDGYHAVIDINGCSPAMRMRLTSTTMKSKIKQEYGADVESRGKFNGHPPLHLYLTGDERAVKRAEVAIKELITTAFAKKDLGSFSSYTTKVIVPYAADVDPEFPLMGKLLGQGASFVRHIEQSSGASRVNLHGKDSNAFEPLHFYISAQSEEASNRAKALCEDLIKHVKIQYDEFLASKNGLPVPPITAPDTSVQLIPLSSTQAQFDYSTNYTSQTSFPGYPTAAASYDQSYNAYYGAYYSYPSAYPNQPGVSDYGYYTNSSTQMEASIAPNSADQNTTVSLKRERDYELDGPSSKHPRIDTSPNTNGGST